jgi:hypothetical protein
MAVDVAIIGRFERDTQICQVVERLIDIDDQIHRDAVPELSVDAGITHSGRADVEREAQKGVVLVRVTGNFINTSLRYFRPSCFLMPSTVAAAIRPIYTAPSAEAAQAELETFADGPWGRKFPPLVAAWRNARDRMIPFFAFPAAVRKVIYTTNAIENDNAQLRKIIKTRGHFPNDEAATKLIWLALRNITARWSRSAHDWKQAMNQFAILYADRFVRPSL